MATDPIVTREVGHVPQRAEDAHKGQVGRVAVIGGCDGAETLMVGAPALAANGALRGGAGLVRVFAPERIRGPIAVLAPCATLHTLPPEAKSVVAAVEAFGADAAVVGPGLGDSLTPDVLHELVHGLSIPTVIDADGLNLLSAGPGDRFSDPSRYILTPHPGEMRRLLAAKGRDEPLDESSATRRAAALALSEIYGCVVILKGRGTVVTDGKRIYVNQTGNAGMATGGTGDVLSGVVAALIGQGMESLEAAILGVHLHGLAGDFAAEELGRWSMTALDLLEYLPEAFCEHSLLGTE